MENQLTEGKQRVCPNCGRPLSSAPDELCPIGHCNGCPPRECSCGDSCDPLCEVHGSAAKGELAAQRLEAARNEFQNAACALSRGGKRGPDSHVSIRTDTWDRFVMARHEYMLALKSIELGAGPGIDLGDQEIDGTVIGTGA